MQKYFVLLFILIVTRTSAQGPDWEWAVAAGGDNCDYTRCMSSDLIGNSSMAGTFRSNSLILGQDTLHNNNGSDNVFIARFDREGNCLWGRTAEICYYEIPYSITVDDFGNTYVLGYFGCDTILFGTDTLLNQNHIPSSFLVKYDSTGDVLWAQSFNFVAYPAKDILFADQMGQVYMTGFFSGDSLMIGNIVLYESIGKMFIAKFDTDGNVLWAKNGGSNDVNPKGLLVQNEKIYVTGYFNYTIEFDSIFHMNPSVYENMFLIQFDTSGHANWITSAGGNGYERGYALACDGSGNIYVTGTFSAMKMNFDSLEILNTTYPDTNDIFLAKYNPSGEVIWALGEGGLEGDEPASVIASGNDVYLAGNFNGGIMLIDSTFIFNALPYYPGMFIAKYDSAGNLIWPHCPQGTGYQSFYDLSLSGNGNIYVAGMFGGANNDLQFGPHEINSHTQCDIFLAKMNLLTGIEETTIPSFLLYPNPAQRKIIIHPSSLRKGDIEIYNSLGMLVYNYNEVEFPTEVDISLLKRGMYFIRLSRGDQFLVQKLIVE